MSLLFELPLGAPMCYALSSPKGDALPAEAIAGVVTSLVLKPFQVIVLEATPLA